MARILIARGLALALWVVALVQAALGPALELGRADADASAPWSERFREGLRDVGVDLAGPDRGLPAVLPGPLDAWGGQRSHGVILAFTLSPPEDLRLALTARETHDRYPPRLRIATERWATDLATIRGTGRPPTQPGTPSTYTVRIPAQALAAGPRQALTISTAEGSWIAPASVELVTARRALRLGELRHRGSLPRAAALSLTLALAAAGLAGAWSRLGGLPRPAAVAGAFAVPFAAAHFLAPSSGVAWGLVGQEAFPRWVHLAAATALGALLMGAVPGTRLATARSRLAALPAGLGFGLFAAAAVPLFWLLRTYEDTPDAATWVRLAPEGAFFPREPLATWLQHLFWLGSGRLTGNPREALALLSCLAGAVSVVCLLRLARLLGREDGWILFGLAASAYGSLQLFFGHVETYPLLVAAQFAYLLVALLALQSRGSPVLPALVYGLAVALHLSAAWLAPSFLVLLILLWRERPARLTGRHLLAVAGAGALVPFLTFVTAAAARYGGEPRLLLDAFHRSLNPSHGFLAWRELASRAHLSDVLNEYALIAPAGAFLVLAAPLLGSSLRRAATDRSLPFLAAAAGPLLLYSVLWRPGLGPYWDWDLFAQVSGPLTLLGGVLLLRAAAAPAVRAYCATVLIGVSLTHAVPLIVAHTRSEHFVDVKSPAEPEISVPPGLRLIDRLDAGDLADEAAHQYRVLGEGHRIPSRVGQAANPGVRSAGPALLWDGGWAHRGTEELTVRVQPGRAVAVLKRIDASVADQAVSVSANGRPVGTWRVPGRRVGTYVTVRFDVPADAVDGPMLRLRFSAADPDRWVTSYFYWVYQPADAPR